mmetsp:Transcript_21049/g.38056  ORF Transcript_21049/g.38056 Transcript_21049/m.38056 type:complete len:383 (+) Transcript_21049:136-1284(+)
MLHMTWLLVLICNIISVSSVSPAHVVTSWVAPSCSSYNLPSCNRGKATARSSSSSYLNLAVQDKILEGLRMKWENNTERQTKNNSINGNNNNNQAPPPSSKQQIPFIIQKIGRGTESEIEEITRVCIDVFFNEQEKDVKTNGEGSNKKKTAPWKALQLAYLRNSQQGDILARNAFKKNQLVDLIVARRVYSLSDATNINGNKADIFDDESQIFNLEQLSSDKKGPGERYITGEIIGFSEVAEKKFGLGGNFETNKRSKPGEKPRPYLSNLSVVEYARQSGVGSKLLDACEEAVRDWNAGHKEIVLQVEEDNPNAIQFYKRRGWEFVFADPTCRRYDTSGFFLRESRITKYAMIKRLDTITNGGESDPGSSFIQKLKNSFFVQ